MNVLKNTLINKNILIYGCGKTGISCFNFLKNKSNINVYDDDQKKIPKKIKKDYFLNIKKITKKNFEYIILSPGININKCNLKIFLLKNKNKIITDLDLFYFYNSKNLKITITGTNGKSTTSKLLYEILKKHKKKVELIGNIGKPVLSAHSKSYRTIFVIEASSYQIDYSKYFKTDHSMILNIDLDHLERHGTVTRYARAKFKLVKKQKKNGYAFLNKNNKYLKKFLKSEKKLPKIIHVNMSYLKKIRKFIKNPYFYNMNNLQNLAFIFAISKKLKLDKNKILNVLNSFKGLRFRQEIIHNNKNLLIINDSKSTSFSSTINLLKSYKNIYWLVGGLYKKGDNFNLKKRNYKNIKAYVFGKHRRFFVKKFNRKIKFKSFATIKKALNDVVKDIKEEKFNKNKKEILFSPSAASFDIFKNFEERGKYFNYLVKKLKIVKSINAN